MSLSAFGPLHLALSGILKVRQPALWFCPLSSGETSATPELSAGRCGSAAPSAEQPAWRFLLVPHKLSQGSWLLFLVFCSLSQPRALYHLLSWATRGPLGSHDGFLRDAPLPFLVLTWSKSCWGHLGRAQGQTAQPPGALVLLFQTLSVGRKLRNGHLVQSLYPSLESLG